jgi:hypothetical protein
MTTSTVIEIPQFVEGEKLIVKADSQILNSIDLCAQRYEMEHVQNFRVLKKAPALEKGGIMHDMVAHYYRNRMIDRHITHAHIVTSECIEIGREALARTSINIEEFEKEDIVTFRNYILAKQFDGWIIRFVERPFSKILYDSDDLMIIIEGIVDLGIERPKEGHAVVDHKTESRKSHPFILSNQFQLYNWAFGEDVIINKIGYQTSLDDKERFRRYTLTWSEALIEEWKVDTIRAIRRAIGWHKEGVFERNRTSCDKYSGCIFKRVCAAEPQVRSHILAAYFKKDKPWDPYTRDEE